MVMFDEEKMRRKAFLARNNELVWQTMFDWNNHLAIIRLTQEENSIKLKFANKVAETMLNIID
jgi:hypothetical protein